MEPREVLTTYKEKLFHCANTQTVEQAAQGGCANSTLRDFQTQLDKNLEQPGLTSLLTLLWGGDWRRDPLRSILTERPRDPNVCHLTLSAEQLI